MLRTLILVVLSLVATARAGPAAAQVALEPRPGSRPEAGFVLDLPTSRTPSPAGVAILGAAAGALIGFGIGYAKGQPTCTHTPCMPEARDPEPARTYALVGAIGGGTLGWLVGRVAARR